MAHIGDVANEPLEQNLAAIKTKAATNTVSVLKGRTRTLGL